jgi:uncharacterized alpha/beta hydrolase family protein
MDFESVKKFFSLFVTALGIFVFIAMIYSIFLITRYAQKQQKINKSYADEMISIIPTLNIKE